MSLTEEANNWRDTEEINKDYVDRFTLRVDETPPLATHRDYIEKHAYGFGERAFHWLWWLIVRDMPVRFNFLEIGVYKGQVLSLMRLCADMQAKNPTITGITPLSNTSGPTGKFTKFPDEDYLAHITKLHEHFCQRQPNIIPLDSTTEEAHEAVAGMELDVLYVDGCHEYECVVSDLLYYPTLLKPGGLLVVDDSANGLHQPWGYFQGIQDVTKAVQTVIETDPAYEHLFAVMHNRVWRKK